MHNLAAQPPIVRRPWLLLSVGLLERGDVNLAHLQHCPHDSVCPLPVLVVQHLCQDRRVDLPRDTELVLQPPARARLTPSVSLSQ
jgi:hypothetical protein